MYLYFIESKTKNVDAAQKSHQAEESVFKESMSDSKKEQSEQWDPSINFADSKDYRWASSQGPENDSMFGGNVTDAKGKLTIFQMPF